MKACAPEKCDLCGLELRSFRFFYDAKLKNGPWAWLCQECFRRTGSFLGVGRGQEYDSQTNEKVRG